MNENNLPIITEIIVKVASRCNLNCSYCYMYNKGDDTYLGQPKFLSHVNIELLAKRIESYVKKYNIKSQTIIFHGGEPLLLDKEFYIKFIETFNKLVHSAEINFIVQTNGTLLDNSWFKLFENLNISIGVSLDGPEKYHNEYRKYHNGKGSFNDIKERLKNKPLSFLSVLNYEIPVKQYYSFWKDLNPEMRGYDILIPDYTYDSPPPYLKYGNKSKTVIGDYLIELYKLWKEDTNRKDITIFNATTSIILGRQQGTQDIGLSRNTSIIIETDGSIECSDSLRIAKNGITKNKFNINNDEIDAIYIDELYQLFYNSHFDVCQQCENCSILNICGSGFLAHRYSTQNGFNNPTIYCKDYAKFITYVQNDIFSNFTKSELIDFDIQLYKYEDILMEIEKYDYLDAITI